MTQGGQALVLRLRPVPTLLILASILHALVWAPLSARYHPEAEGEHSRCGPASRGGTLESGVCTGSGSSLCCLTRELWGPRYSECGLGVGVSSLGVHVPLALQMPSLAGVGEVQLDKG